MYIDADNRQVGEANVFPPAMRLDRPTLWRTCTYSGTRYQPDLPMNVTALRIMRDQWRHMMVIIRRVSDAYRARFPEVDERGWTVGDIERMTVCVLALPTYLLMRVENRVENGKLHPALSSAFRLTDGLRMLMHHMLFVPFGEPTRSGTTPMTGFEAHQYAERNYSFHTEQGVCAGPPAMVDDFLAVILDRADPKGGWPDKIDPEVQAALDDGRAGGRLRADGPAGFRIGLLALPDLARPDMPSCGRSSRPGTSPTRRRSRPCASAARGSMKSPRTWRLAQVGRVPQEPPDRL